MKRISILGSTGSIGRSTLNVVESYPDRFQVVALAAGRNVDVALEQAQRWKPLGVAVDPGMCLGPELADLAVYTPLARRRLVTAVVASSFCGLVVDSIIFLWLAFGSLDFLSGQIVGKSWMVLLSIPFVSWLRRRDERLGIQPA